MNNNEWNNILDPKILKPNLITSALYLTTFEMLRSSVIDHIKHFFSDEYTSEKGWIPSDKYYQELRISKNKKVNSFEPSLKWLLENEIISTSDIDNIREARKVRNKIAHELLQIVSKGLSQNDIQLFQSMTFLIRKIDTWWVKNVDMAIDEDMCHLEIDDKEIQPGSSIILQAILDIALGDEELSNSYINELNKK